MCSADSRSFKRTIRRSQLREIVPLADSTIYEMEQRGEFPRRFALTSMRGLGPRRSRGLAGFTPIDPSYPRAIS